MCVYARCFARTGENPAGVKRFLQALLCFLHLGAMPLQVALADQAVPRFITLEEPPTNYNRNGRIIGTTVDLVREMAARLGEPVDFEFVPPARALLLAVNTPDVFLFTAGFTQERQDLGFQAIGPVITRLHVLYALKGRQLTITSEEDIAAQGLTVSGVDGDWRTAFLQGKGITVETTAEHLLNLKKLLAQRTDLWISSDIEAPPILAAAGAGADDIEVVYVLKTAPSYILASPGTDPDLIARWREAFLAVTASAPFISDFAKKWSQALGMNLFFSQKTGLAVLSSLKNSKM